MELPLTLPVVIKRVLNNVPLSKDCFSKKILAVATLSILWASLPHNVLAQEIYRWTDENGKVHFSDRPPADKPAENITDTTKTINVDSSRHEQQKLEKIFAKETPEEKAMREQKLAETKQKEQRQAAACNKAREDLRFFKEERFYWVDEAGKGHNASEQEREQTIKKLQALINQHC